MKSILLPTDFSKNSVNAIEFAVELFSNQDCDFHILNVQKASSFISDDMMTVSSSATIYRTIVDAAMKSINNIISKVESRYKNERHNFHSLIDYDNFTDAINQVSEKHNIDLIIMGTKGASGLEKALFGSNTVHVIQRCNKPILAIPDGCKFSDLTKIVFATTNLKAFVINELKVLKEFVDVYNAQLSILHIADKNHATYKTFDNSVLYDTYFEEAKHDYIDSISRDMFDEIHDYNIANDTKMLVVKNKKHSFLGRLFSKHGLETLAFKIDIPFLVLPSTD
ncbi:universal stress protein [Hyunsoonleella aestuarii]|uniref:Universal stress protein n=1 Tax=Hyunsoonleella aestuarii TaxID=912802 RepID=A0ABP8EBA9_9FLAO|nr:universal stress protein [Hyunsoonleella aestuarii]